MADNNRARYETLKVVDLRAIAKTRGIKGTSTMKKADLIEAMVRKDAEDATQEKPAAEHIAVNHGEETVSAESGREASSAEPKEEPSSAESREENNPSLTHRKTVRTRPSKKITPRKPPRSARNQSEENQTEKEEAPVKEKKSAEASEKRTAKREGKNSRRRNTEQEKSSRNSKESNSRENSKKKQNTSEESENARKRDKERVPEDSEKKNQEHESKNQEREPQEEVSGILEVLSDGYGFIRSGNYLPGDNDIYVSPSQIRRFGLKTGDIVTGIKRRTNPNDKFAALMFIEQVNGISPEENAKRVAFEDLTPIFPNERIRLERPGCSLAMRVVDLISPIGKGQRGMIVSQPKAGKTTLLKEIARSVLINHPEMHLIILLIDERPEEVTDMKESIVGDNVEVIYSTFDETPEHHKRVSEMVIERAKRLVEQKRDVIILLDSITRLARAYNLTVAPSGRTLSGGLDPAALHMPKRFFGAARNMREGGSLTILATALVETGSKMDDVVYEEFKGTGNMELILDRKMSERRIFPAIDINRSGTRRDDLLLNKQEQAVCDIIHRGLNGRNKEEVTETILNMFAHTKSNEDFIHQIIRRRIV